MSNRGASAVKAKGGESEPLNQVPVLDVSNITPEQFWAEYVAPRKPVLIRGHPTDLSWRATGLWTDDYLVARAGSAQVLVEVRGGPGEGYGRGLKRRMAFGDLVRRLAAGDTHLYLTAQQVPVAPDGHPALMAEPLLSLAAAGDFPAAPALAGHLVPQSVNLWMGAAPEGSSSGLHHDFHDNLYLLLRGAKRFRLYPPAAAPRMYTVGRLVRVYDNGRIVYEGQGDIAPDGTSASEVAHWRRRRAAEAAMAEAEAAVQRGDKGAADALAAAEAALEAALDAELQEALGGGGGGGGDSEDWEDMRDDFEEEEEDEDSEEQQERGRKQQKQAGKQAGKGAGGSKGKAGGGEGEEEGEGEGGLIREPDSDTPPSFCRVPIGDPGVSDAHIAAQWPRFPGRAAALEARVEAGCMLYLPAGWFHEVTSYGAAGPANATTNGNPSAGSSAESSTGGGHLAFNYWFHPPDRLDPSRTTGFNRPYTSDYWPALWRARCAAGLPGGMEPGLGAQPPPAAEGPGTDPTDPAHPHHAWRKDAAAGPPVLVHHDQEEGEEGEEEEEEDEEGEEDEDEESEGEEDEDEDEEMADGEEDADLSPPRRQQQQQGQGQQQGQSPQGGSGPPRSRVQAVRDLLEAIAAARAAGAADGAAAAAAGGGGGGGGGGAAAEEGLPAGMTEEDYQVLLQLDQAQRRGQAMQAMRAFFERQMKLRELQRLRSRLPPGRRHHPVIRVARAVRRWRPAQPLGRKGAAAAAAEAEAAGGAGGAGGGGAQAAVGAQHKGKNAGAAGGVRVAGGVRKVGRR